MRITDILDIKSIKVGLEAVDKETLIDEMIELASASGKVLDKEEAKKEIFKREKVMSTGVGKGIALPHAKTNVIADTVGALAVLKNNLDYESLDGSPINIIFLLLGSENNVGIHLRLLSRISRVMNNDTFREKLVASANEAECLALFKEFEEE